MLTITQEAFKILFGLSLNFDDLSRSQITLRAIFIHNMGAELLNTDEDLTLYPEGPENLKITTPKEMLYQVIQFVTDDVADTKDYSTNTYEEYPDFDGYTLVNIIDMGEHIKELITNHQ